MAEGRLVDEQEEAHHKRHRDREDKQPSRKKRRRDESSDSGPSVSSSSVSSSSESSFSDESSDAEVRRRERKKRKDRKGSRHHSSGKEKSKDEKSKTKKKHKKRRHRHSDEDDDTDREKKRRLLKEAKKILKRHKLKENLYSSELQESGRKIEKLTPDDYFLKSSEFATWLKEERGIFFSDLSSEETHKIFEAFVDTWNAGRLNQKYYDGIKQAPRTNHNWAIKKGPEDLLIIDKDEEFALTKKKENFERKKFREEHEALLDEILPKATGRERLMEKKAVRREQARAREDSPELMKERDIMGGGGDFQQRLAREKAHRDKKQAEKAAVYNEKRSAFEEKETAAMDQLRALVNVAGGKITIAKRGD